MSATVGTRYKVLYDYDATIPDELTIRVGQTVYVTEELDKGWVRGYIGDKVGMLPAAYVEPDTAGSGAPNQPLPPAPSALKLHQGPEVAAAGAETAQVIEEFPAKDPSQLPLVKDQLVVIFRKFPTGWASGESQGKTGMFPLKNVRILDMAEAAALIAHSTSPTPSGSLTSRKTSNKEKRMSRVRSNTVSSTPREEMEDEASSGSGGAPATVLFPYNSTDKGQLSLLPGETIWVLDKLGGGWWKGRNEDGDIGFFPGSYVRETPGGSGASSPTPGSREAAMNGGAAVAAAVASNGGTNLKKAATVARPSLRKAVAVFKYEAKSASELSFDVGDEVLVFPMKDGESSGWWTGALASVPTVVAHFPATYVKLTGGVVEDSLLRVKEEKSSKRKSQPATPRTFVGTSASTTSIGSSTTSSKSKPPTMRPPARPGDLDIEGLVSSGDDLLSPSGIRPHAPLALTNGSSHGASSMNGSNGELESVSRATEQATKVSEQTKQGLIKLQQQSKTVFEGMLQRMDAADKNSARLENAMREMHKMLQTSEAARTKLAQQNQVLYQQLTDLKTQLNKEASARSSLEARLSKLEQGR